MTSPKSEPLSEDLIRKLGPLRELLHGPVNNVVFPVVGSGLSRGLDSWHALLSDLIRQVPEADRPEIEAALERQDYLDVAAFLEAEAAVGREGIAAAIRDRYRRPKQARPETFDSIAALPVRHFATTNYDPWLKDAVAQRLRAAPRVYTPGDQGAFSDVAPSSPPLVLMLHGDADRPESCVLSAKGYRHLMHGDAAYRQGLAALLAQRHWLFVGHSLRDPDFLSLLNAWTEAFGAAGSPGAPRHVFLGAGLTKLEQRRLLDLGVQPIEYGARGDHALLPAVLSHLAQGPTVAPAIVTGAPPTTPVRPRVLAAGARFGLSEPVWRRCRDLWRSGQDDPARAGFEIAQELQRADGFDRAQIAAIVRYDVILDLSPWGAFRRWASLGFRDIEQDPGWEASGAPGYFCAHVPFESSRDVSLRQPGPGLAGALRRLLSDGLAVCGLTDAPDERAWLESLLGLWPGAPVLLDRRLRDLDLGRPTQVAEHLDSVLADATLADYERAVRVVAGRVELLGDEGWRPIQDVFVDLEVVRAMIAPRAGDDPRKAAEGDGRKGQAASDEWSARELETEDRLRRVDEERGPFARPDAVVDARALPGLGGRVFLEGVAGSGKTTLLKWLAAGIGTDGEPRVFVPLANLAPPEPGRDVLDACVEAALDYARMPSAACAARGELRAHLEQGRGLMLLDGYDEARAELRNVLFGALGKLPPALKVVLSARPTESLPAWASFVQVTLHGLAPGGSERFLRAYFGTAAWVPALLRELPRLPEGERWVRTPVLLLLVSGLYRRHRTLPDATLDLYADAVRGLLEWRAQRLVGNAAREESERALEVLAAFAHARLMPRDGLPRVVFARAELEALRQPLVLGSGLLTGSETLRFAHLTLGEYLAARVSARSLDDETARWLGAHASVAPALHAREVLPMAWATADAEHLARLFERAVRSDTSTHTVFRLLLRALTYGGAGAIDFARRHGMELVDLLAARLAPDSGRFGDAERALCRAAERALGAVGRHMPPDGARRLTPSVPQPSEVNDELHILAATLGLLPARLRLAGRHDTSARRLGQACARGGATPLRVVDLTPGEWSPHVRAAAVQALATDPESKPLLRERLTDDDNDVRAAAVQALATDPESKPLLRERLTDDDNDVRAAAVQALATDPESKPLLRERLTDDNWNVRAAAFQALATDPESKPLLRERLTDDDNDVRAAAFQALATDPESKPLLRERLTDDDNDVRAAAVQALATDPESKPLLRERLTDDNWNVRAAAVQALATDPESKPLLRERLTDDDNDVRAAAVQALATDPESKPLLRERLTDDNWNVRAAAVQALATDPESKPLLRERLTDDYSDVRAAAFQALATDPESKPLLRERLTDDNWNVRAAAVQALATDPESKPLLRERLTDDNWNVRAAAVQALATDPESKPLLRERLTDDDNDVRAAAFQALATDPESKPLLRERLTDDYSDVRAAAVQALATDPESKPLLRERLTDDNSNVRAAAFQALATDPESKPLLRERLTDDNWNVRAAAVQALATDPESKPLLRERLTDDNWNVRAAAFQALATDPESKPLLRERLTDDDNDVRAAAVQALATDPESKPLLRERLTDDNWNVRAAAFQALATDPESKPLLRERLTDDNWNVRAAAVQALATDPESKPLLRERLTDDDNDVRAAAVQALATDPESKPLLRERLTDDDNDVRAAAVQALATDPESKPLLRERLTDDNWNVRAAAVQALATDPESKPLLRERLTDDYSDVRAAAFQALATDPESKPLLRERLTDDNWNVRAAAVQALATDPESKPLLRERLTDDNWNVRAAAFQALATDPESKPLLRERLTDDNWNVRAAAFQALATGAARGESVLRAIHDPALRLALRCVGADPQPDQPTPEELLGLESRLAAFLRAPHALHLDGTPGLAQAIIGWLVVRLGWGSPTGHWDAGRLWGELREPIVASLHSTIVLRVAMLDSLLPAARGLHPHHNLIEAWKVARYLRTTPTRPLCLFLVCADLPFAELALPALAAGEVRWGATFYGFRLAEGPVTVPDEGAESFAELLLARDPLVLWRAWDDRRRAGAIDRLGTLADRGDVEALSVAPLLTRLGPELPAPLRRALVRRLAPNVSDAVQLVEQFLSLASDDVAQAAQPGATPTSPGTALAALFDALRECAQDDAAALPPLDGLAMQLHPDVASADDALEVVRRLERVRDRRRTPTMARALLAAADSLASVRPADTAYTRAVNELRLNLRLYLEAKGKR